MARIPYVVAMHIYSICVDIYIYVQHLTSITHHTPECRQRRVALSGRIKRSTNLWLVFRLTKAKSRAFLFWFSFSVEEKESVKPKVVKEVAYICGLRLVVLASGITHTQTPIEASRPDRGKFIR